MMIILMMIVIITIIIIIKMLSASWNSVMLMNLWKTRTARTGSQKRIRPAKSACMVTLNTVFLSISKSKPYITTSPTIHSAERQHNRKYQRLRQGRKIRAYCKSVCPSGTRFSCQHQWTFRNNTPPSGVNKGVCWGCVPFVYPCGLVLYDGTGDGAAKRAAQPADPLSPQGQDRGTPGR